MSHEICLTWGSLLDLRQDKVEGKPSFPWDADLPGQGPCRGWRLGRHAHVTRGDENEPRHGRDRECGAGSGARYGYADPPGRALVGKRESTRKAGYTP